MRARGVEEGEVHVGLEEADHVAAGAAHRRHLRDAAAASLAWPTRCMVCEGSSHIMQAAGCCGAGVGIGGRLNAEFV